MADDDTYFNIFESKDHRDLGKGPQFSEYLRTLKKRENNQPNPNNNESIDADTFKQMIDIQNSNMNKQSTESLPAIHEFCIAINYQHNFKRGDHRQISSNNDCRNLLTIFNLIGAVIKVSCDKFSQLKNKYLEYTQYRKPKLVIADFFFENGFIKSAFKIENHYLRAKVFGNELETKSNEQFIKNLPETLKHKLMAIVENKKTTKKKRKEPTDEQQTATDVLFDAVLILANISPFELFICMWVDDTIQELLKHVFVGNVAAHFFPDQYPKKQYTKIDIYSLFGRYWVPSKGLTSCSEYVREVFNISRLFHMQETLSYLYNKTKIYGNFPAWYDLKTNDPIVDELFLMTSVFIGTTKLLNYSFYRDELASYKRKDQSIHIKKTIKKTLK